jgi:hypothetical protein
LVKYVLFDLIKLWNGLPIIDKIFGWPENDAVEGRESKKL